MGHRIDTESTKIEQLEVNGLQLTALSTGELADDGVYTSDIPDSVYGQMFLVYLNSGEAGIFMNDDGAIVSVQANALFSVTVTTDTKVNVYFASNVLKVENKAGSAKTAYIKLLG